MATDPFFILGVDEDASDDEIKRRYLAPLSRLCTPSAIGSLRSCWLSTAARSRGSRRPVCHRRRRAGTGGFSRPR